MTQSASQALRATLQALRFGFEYHRRGRSQAASESCWSVAPPNPVRHGALEPRHRSWLRAPSSCPDGASRHLRPAVRTPQPWPPTLWRPSSGPDWQKSRISLMPRTNRPEISLRQCVGQPRLHRVAIGFAPAPRYSFSNAIACCAAAWMDECIVCADARGGVTFSWSLRTPPAPTDPICRNSRCCLGRHRCGVCQARYAGRGATAMRWGAHRARRAAWWCAHDLERQGSRGQRGAGSSLF